MSNKTEIYVYADWEGLDGPILMGILSAHQAKGRKAFSFEYNKQWLQNKEFALIDPDLQFYSGAQFANNKENFSVFLDSMPDTWGRTLMRRREAIRAKTFRQKPNTLYDIDFLLGVFDETRMGALRFKLNPDGDFLDNNIHQSTPPWSSIPELQEAVKQLETDQNEKTTNKWLKVLVAPGSSLGGARPKANVVDNKNNLWIAKFPSKFDEIDKAAWEYLAYCLAIDAGINMSSCKIQKINGKHHTFFTKRFDRIGKKRIHFASAMTMTGNTEETIKIHPASYLQLVDFIQNHGFKISENLAELWRRIIFNICISNTDDHLRNHGFILTENGWILSPAYDLNPSIDKDGLAMNIDMHNNALDFELALSVGEYFRLNEKQMIQIIDEVISAVNKWRLIADKIGIPKNQQSLMTKAFNTELTE